jgi:hypothetical protein
LKFVSRETKQIKYKFYSSAGQIMIIFLQDIIKNNFLIFFYPANPLRSAELRTEPRDYPSKNLPIRKNGAKFFK